MKSTRLSAQSALLLTLAVLLISGACLATPTPPPAPTPTATCQPSPNLYNLHASVYEDYARGNNITPQDALKLLTAQVQRWSAFQDYPSSLALYRVTVTLISPDLYRAALINESVRLGLGGASIQQTLDGFEQGRRDSNQLRFLVTVAYAQFPNVNPAAQTIALPAKSLTMLDKNGQDVLPFDVEGVFGSPLNVVKGPYSGYVMFDLDLDTCNPRLDINENTSVTLKLDGIQVGDASQTQNMRWTIHLAPLLNVVRPTQAPIPNPPSVPIPNTVKIEPRNTPPSPSTTSSVPDSTYWSELARYVWGQLTAHPAP